MNTDSSSKTSIVAVVGLGYVGLPVVVAAERAGHTVIAIDADPSKIRHLQAGESYIEDIDHTSLKEMKDRGRFKATSHYEDAHGFDVAVIAVPTPLRESIPDLSYIESAVESLAAVISPGATVILESTTYPGTTEEVVVPILERVSGLRVGHEIHVGYSPERIDPGNPTWTLSNTPKIVSGINESSLERVAQFYESFVDTVVPTKSPREAEMAKLLENTFRHVNIALVNELAMFARDLNVDIWSAVDAAASKPFGFMKFTPGPGVGGHCLPVDPSYLSWQVRRTLGRDFRFVGLANDVNDHMPDFVVQRAMEVLNDRNRALRGARVCVAGLAYKKNSGDRRESPSNRILSLLERFGAEVVAADPYVADQQWPVGVTRVEFTREEFDRADLVILVTDHDDFDLTVPEHTTTPVLDTRNRLDGSAIDVFATE